MTVIMLLLYMVQMNYIAYIMLSMYIVDEYAVHDKHWVYAVNNAPDVQNVVENYVFDVYVVSDVSGNYGKIGMDKVYNDIHDVTYVKDVYGVQEANYAHAAFEINIVSAQMYTLYRMETNIQHFCCI